METDPILKKNNTRQNSIRPKNKEGGCCQNGCAIF